MKPYEKKDWRTCANCIHNRVCKKESCKPCHEHIFDADPQIYGNFRELLEPICEWLKTHYPNDAQLLIDTTSAKLLIRKESFYTREITDFSLPETIRKATGGLL